MTVVTASSHLPSSWLLCSQTWHHWCDAWVTYTTSAVPVSPYLLRQNLTPDRPGLRLPTEYQEWAVNQLLPTIPGSRTGRKKMGLKLTVPIWTWSYPDSLLRRLKYSLSKHEGPRLSGLPANHVKIQILLQVTVWCIHHTTTAENNWMYSKLSSCPRVVVNTEPPGWTAWHKWITRCIVHADV